MRRNWRTYSSLQHATGFASFLLELSKNLFESPMGLSQRLSATSLRFFSAAYAYFFDAP